MFKWSAYGRVLIRNRAWGGCIEDGKIGNTGKMKIGRRTSGQKDSNMGASDGERGVQEGLTKRKGMLKSSMETYDLETQRKNIFREDISIQVT